MESPVGEVSGNFQPPGGASAADAGSLSRVVGEVGMTNPRYGAKGDCHSHLQRGPTRAFTRWPRQAGLPGWQTIGTAPIGGPNAREPAPRHDHRLSPLSGNLAGPPVVRRDGDRLRRLGRGRRRPPHRHLELDRQGRRPGDQPRPVQRNLRTRPGTRRTTPAGGPERHRRPAPAGRQRGTRPGDRPGGAERGAGPAAHRRAGRRGAPGGVRDARVQRPGRGLRSRPDERRAGQ